MEMIFEPPTVILRNQTCLSQLVLIDTIATGTNATSVYRYIFRFYRVLTCV
jgi:hypothetical protein